MRMRMKYHNALAENQAENDGFAARSLIARSTKVDSFPKFVLTTLRICHVGPSRDRFFGLCPPSSGVLPPSPMSLVLLPDSAVRV